MLHVHLHNYVRSQVEAEMHWPIQARITRHTNNVSISLGSEWNLSECATLTTAHPAF